jgi:hypothetical protein
MWHQHIHAGRYAPGSNRTGNAASSDRTGRANVGARYRYQSGGRHGVQYAGPGCSAAYR